LISQGASAAASRLGRSGAIAFRQLALAATCFRRFAAAPQIEATDREIAALAPELYGLSEEESPIVEERTAR
jgi:hypothetical protein